MSNDQGGARNEGESIVVIANPRAGGGRAGARRSEIEAGVARAFTHSRVLWTEHAGHGTLLARQVAEEAARNGEAPIIAALGGDGTCHEVVNGLFVDGVPVHRRVVFAVLPFGTGGDLVRTLHVKKNLQDALWVASTGMTLPLDVIKLTFPTRGAGGTLGAGQARGAGSSLTGARSEICINVVGFGINARVCELANKSAKRFGGTATFLSSILRALRTFEPVPVTWSWDGPDGPGGVTMETHAAFCANGQYCGAGLFVGKGGSMADGVLDLSIVPKMAALNAIGHLPKLYSGDFNTVPGVVQARVTRVEVSSAIPVETDGESIGDAPVVIEVLPRALMVRGGWLKPPFRAPDHSEATET